MTARYDPKFNVPTNPLWRNPDPKFTVPTPPTGPTRLPEWPKTVNGPTLKPSDEQNARSLSRDLSGIGSVFREAVLPHHDVRITYDPQTGIPRGPEGEPLVKVQRGKDTLYVDPNTNQYYVAKPPNPNIQYFRMPDPVAEGPYPLPPNAQFSNSHFSDADVKKLTWDANSPIWRDVLF